MKLTYDISENEGGHYKYINIWPSVIMYRVGCSKFENILSRLCNIAWIKIELDYCETILQLQV